jgi:hypothetical protein
MLIEKAYQKYLIKVEGNATNDNIATDRGRFAIQFNEALNRYVEWLLDKRGEDDIRYIQALIVKNEVIEPESGSESEEIVNFTLPPNYFGFINAYASCSKGDCNNKKVDLFELEAESENGILQDEHSSPSFLWREAPFTLSSNEVNVYTKDFTVENIKLTYYRYAQQIALLDSEDPEGFFDEELGFDLDDKVINRIISLTAGEFELNNENPFFQQNLRRATAKI